MLTSTLELIDRILLLPHEVWCVALKAVRGYQLQPEIQILEFFPENVVEIFEGEDYSLDQQFGFLFLLLLLFLASDLQNQEVPRLEQIFSENLDFACKNLIVFDVGGYVFVHLLGSGIMV